MTKSVIARRMRGGRCYEVDTDKARLDLALIHDFLANCSHWARGVPLDVLERAIANSLCFGLYRDGAQIGFARAVSDDEFKQVAHFFGSFLTDDALSFRLQ